MSVRRLIVEVDVEGLNVAEFCRQHGVSRWFFYDLRRRYLIEGDTVLDPGSRAPRTVANRTPGWVEDLIIDERKRLEGNGLDAGAATIAFHLKARLGAETPSEATVWRVLSRRGFITPDPSKAPKHSYRSFEAERANERWQIDDTPWQLADGTGVKIINLVDDCTRVLTSSRAAVTCDTESAFEAFCEGASRWGWPARFLSDNAGEFRNGLADAVRALGVESGHSRPYHPQTCGKVERFHQTLKKWLSVQPAPGSLRELQVLLDQFATIYNHHRPHRSLKRRIPAEVFATTPKAGPTDRALDTPTHIHRVKVNNGTLSAGQRYTISVGAAHTGNTATVIITGLNCHVFINGQLIRKLTLDPSRKLQPIYPQRGHPKIQDDQL